MLHLEDCRLRLPFWSNRKFAFFVAFLEIFWGFFSYCFPLHSGPLSHLTMACPLASSSNVPVFPTILAADEIAKEYPFSHPETKEIDLKIMRARLPRILAVLVTLIAQHNKQKYQTPDLQVRENEVTRPNNIFIEFPDVSGKETSMRFLVPNIEKLTLLPHFYIIGFFGFAMEESSVVKQIWDLDDKLVTAIPTFDGILAYPVVPKAENEKTNESEKGS